MHAPVVNLETGFAGGDFDQVNVVEVARDFDLVLVFDLPWSESVDNDRVGDFLDLFRRLASDCRIDDRQVERR